MSFIEIPTSRLEPSVLEALLEEFASRDGTDYGEQETSLEQRVSQLRRQLTSGDLALLYDTLGELWDLVARDQVTEFVDEQGMG